jgi:hypothetical protein
MLHMHTLIVFGLGAWVGFLSGISLKSHRQQHRDQR